MRESWLYLQFFKHYFVGLLIPMMLGVILAFWVFKEIPELFVTERLFEFPYTYENAAAVEKQSEEAVTLLRSLQLKEQLGMQETVVAVFKPGPFTLKIQTKSRNAETAVNQLNKLAGFTTQNYPVREIGTEVTFVEERFFWKFGLLGALGGLGIGLIFSLTLAYLRNF